MVLNEISINSIDVNRNNNTFKMSYDDPFFYSNSVNSDWNYFFLIVPHFDRDGKLSSYFAISGTGENNVLSTKNSIEIKFSRITEYPLYVIRLDLLSLKECEMEYKESKRNWNIKRILE